jgi:Ca2+-binding RTX toxin-like protein
MRNVGSRLAAIACGSLIGLGLASTTAAAHAAAVDESCDGKAATMVITTGGQCQGTPGDDVIVVTTSDFVALDAADGDDTICGGPGGNTLYGGPGDDTIFGGLGTDYIAGDEYADPSDVAPARDDDTIDAGAGNDQIFDDWGNDTYVGGDGSDTLTLGEEPDESDFPDSSCVLHSAIKPVLDIGAGTVTGYGDDTFNGFEAYVGGPFLQTIIGTSHADRIDSGPCGTSDIRTRGGNDVITAQSQNAGKVHAGPGADTITSYFDYGLHAGSGNDRITMKWTTYDEGLYPRSVDGGPGKDWLVDDFTTMDTIDLRRGIGEHDHGRLGQPLHIKVPVRHVENARQVSFASLHGSELIGTSGPNTLIAPKDEILSDGTQATHSVLRGLGGDDHLLAGHHDTAYGGPGHDHCRAAHRYSCEVH